MYTDLVESFSDPNHPNHNFIKQHINDLRLKLYARGFLIDFKNKNRHELSRNDEINAVCINFIPIPLPYPQHTFNLSKIASKAILQLTDKLSNDNGFIETHFSVVKDPFISRLYKIYKKIYTSKSEKFPKVRCYFNRSDFMFQANGSSIHSNNSCNKCGSNPCVCSSTLWPKLIEPNCIAISLSTHSTNLSKELESCSASRTNPSAVISKIFNHAINAMDKLSDSPYQFSKCILIIYYEIASIFDWGPIGTDFEDNYNIKVFYYTLEELVKMQSKKLLRFSDQNLILAKFNAEYRVNLIHFRTCYIPQQLDNEKQWEMFEILHMSNAIKVPEISTYLVNNKYAQMIWSNPDFISKLPPHLVEPLLNTRTEQSDPALDLEMAKDAIENPNEYVLKNHLEGGHGVFFENEIAEKLRQNAAANEYILSKRIFPPIQKAIFVSNYGPKLECTVEDSVTELGIFSLAVFTGTPDGGQADLLDVDTYVGRTKRANQSGGGINVGIAYLSSLTII